MARPRPSEALVDAVLPGPYRAAPSNDGGGPGAATCALVEAQVDALLHASPAFLGLEPSARRDLRRDLAHVASYTAELMRDDFYQSLRLGQRPVLRVRERETNRPAVTAPFARSASARTPPATGTPAPASEGFTTAANAIGRVTRDTLQAISFPTFVADLIRGTFNAVVNASIQQMEAYGQLLANVAKTVDQFMADNISDNQARDWLAQSYPEHITVRADGEHPVAAPREGSEERPAPSFAQLGVADGVSLDEESIESTLVPAARRKLAQTRHQMLATMVLMGMQRIVITAGKIKATMGFHIDTTDRSAEQHATDFDLRVAAAGAFGFGPWSVSVSTSVAYVTSNRSQQSHEMNVDADLTSEVELHFKSDYFPLERFVDRAGIQQLQGATAVPEANTPTTSDNAAAPASPAGPAYHSPRSRRTAAAPTPEMRPLGQLPVAPAAPTAPTAPAAPTPPATPATPATPDAPAAPDAGAAPGTPAAPDAPATPTMPPSPAAAATPASPPSAALPTAPAIPSAPAIPAIPTIPAIPAIPAIPSIPGFPRAHSVSDQDPSTASPRARR